MIALYLDSNIWLSFYELTDDTLDELGRIPEWVEQGKLYLPLPQQVVDEVKRNRERVISRSLGLVDKSRLTKAGWPRAVHDFEQRQELDDLQSRYEELRTAMRQQLLDFAVSKTLPADETIEDIFQAVDAIRVTDQLVSRAEQRRALGNPPGKPNTLGDQIIWEALLESVPNSTDLHIVARDGDFASELEPSAPNPFLAEEWQDRKGAGLYLHRRLRELSPILADATGDEVTFDADDYSWQVSDAVLALTTSRSFQGTHNAIAALSDVHEFTDAEVKEIADAFRSNDQVHQIAGDADVKAFYTRFVKENWHRMDWPFAGVDDTRPV